VEVSFKPENPDGLILFNGQNEFGIGDFVSLILKDGVPEFRFVRFFFSYTETCRQFHQHFYVQIFCMNVISAAFTMYMQLEKAAETTLVQKICT